MNLFLRLLLLLLLTAFRPRCDILGPTRKRFVVWPPDLDVLGHVNNELLELIGKQGPSPALPAWIEAWNRENAG